MEDEVPRRRLDFSDSDDSEDSDVSVRRRPPSGQKRGEDEVSKSGGESTSKEGTTNTREHKEPQYPAATQRRPYTAIVKAESSTC